MPTIVENIANQWHLLQTQSGKLDLNVARVWGEYSGTGVSVFVIDDGFDYNHTDLAPNYDRSSHFDFYGTNGTNADSDPFGLDWNNHGTAVMGLIGAGRNGTGAVGVAYDATLTGYRIGPSDGATFVDNVANAIRNAADHGADTVNLSLSYPGLFDGGQSAGAISWLHQAIDHAVDTGRGGLGTILTKSAGNAREWGTDASALSFNGNTHQVVVAAVGQNGYVSDYSNPGAGVLVSGFGSHLDVVTLDRSGNAGWNNTDFVTDFDGTSAATAMVNGVVALMLDANANLGWRDVQTILAHSARHVGSAVDGHTIAGDESAPWQWNAAKTWNGGGLHFSRDYGFGLVDALAAVRLAESWQVTSTSANQSQFALTLHAGAPVSIGTVGTSFAASWSATLGLERVRVELDFATTALGDVEVYLVSPNGTTIKLLADLGQTGGNGRGSTDAFDGTWSFETQALRGEELSGVGQWTVRVIDDIPGGTTTVRSVAVTAFGSAAPFNDTYVYTDAFSAFPAGRTALTDLDGGVDWLNSSAVTTASIVRLDAGTSRLDGTALTVRGVENVYAGDGADIIYGSGAANTLIGARGADQLLGLNGNDRLTGGTGNDRLDGGNHGDVLHGDAGSDTLLGGSGNDSLFGDDGNDTLAGGTNTDNLAGGTGNDRLDGGRDGDLLYGDAGSDSLLGGTGNDSLFGGTGNDILTGGTGRDKLSGGTGRDRFDFNAYTETGRTGLTRDIIKDFVRGYDKIDLSTIDANGSALRNARFTLASKEGADFADARGQLIWDKQNNAGTTHDRTVISGDVNGDGRADFSIELTGLINLRASDFVL